MKSRGPVRILIALLGAVGLATPGAVASARSADTPRTHTSVRVQERTLAGCSGIGGGKYNCRVWKTAPSYRCTTTDQTDSCDGQPVGRLKAGTNYFFCQTLGGYYSDGRYYNHYWAQTDDDSGNRRVWISVVYISGGVNDGRIPGLPAC